MELSEATCLSCPDEDSKTHQISEPLPRSDIVAATFGFNRIPPEIRAQIWELTVEPRTVEVRIGWEREKEKLCHCLVSTTPVPPPLQTCREARYQGLYQQAFSEVGDERRYVWVNFDIDMISIGTCDFGHFSSVAPMIKRLKFQRDNSDSIWFHFESKRTQNFVNAEEILVVCEDRLEGWWGASEDISWPCALENVTFFDPHDGRMMNVVKMDKMFNDLKEEEERRIEGSEEEQIQQLLEDIANL